MQTRGVAEMSRERLLAETFVEVADTLVDEFDVIELLETLAERCVELFDAAACGLLLADTSGRLRVMAASSEQVRLLELFQLQNDEGPCFEAFRTGQPVVSFNLDAATGRWPRFSAAARDVGFASVQALPMRLRDQVIGALNLFHAEPVESSSDDIAVAQALADVATIGLLQIRTRRREAALAEQLQVALNSRVIIEQAKGVVAERRGVDPADAFELLRSHARGHGLLLSNYARSVVDGTSEAPFASAPAEPAPKRERRPQSSAGRPGDTGLGSG